MLYPGENGAAQEPPAVPALPGSSSSHPAAPINIEASYFPLSFQYVVKNTPDC